MGTFIIITPHYSDVAMSAKAFQISIPTVSFVVSSSAHQRNLQMAVLLDRTDINPTLAPISTRHRMLISKWYIQLCFPNVKWNIYPTSEWSTSFRQRNSIIQITKQDQIDNSPTSAAISGQHRNYIKMAYLCRLHRCRNQISIWHRMTLFRQPNSIVSLSLTYRLLFSLTYSVVDTKTIQKWHFHHRFVNTDVRYRWMISCPQRNFIVFISFDINRYIGPT